MTQSLGPCMTLATASISTSAVPLDYFRTSRWRPSVCDTPRDSPPCKSTLIMPQFRACSNRYSKCPKSRHRNKKVCAIQITFNSAHSTYIVRSGYPPRSLTIVPELPLSSLGLKSGDQVIVNQIVSSLARDPPSPPRAKPASSQVPRASLSQPSRLASSSTGPDYVDTPNGVLVHRVR